MSWDVVWAEVQAAVATLAGPAGLVLVVLLALLLAAHAVIREVGPPRMQRWLLVVDFAAVPLLVLFAVIVIVRFVRMG